MGYVSRSGYVDALGFPHLHYWYTIVQAETDLLSLDLDLDNLDGIGYCFDMENANVVLSTITVYRDTTPIATETNAAATREEKYGIIDVSAMTGIHRISITTQMAAGNVLELYELDMWAVTA